MGAGCGWPKPNNELILQLFRRPKIDNTFIFVHISDGQVATVGQDLVNIANITPKLSHNTVFANKPHALSGPPPPFPTQTILDWWNAIAVTLCSSGLIERSRENV